MAQSHALLHGAKLFENLRLVEFSSLLSYPIVAFHEFVLGSVDGIILCMRQVYFLLAGLTAIVVYRSLRVALPRSASLMASLSIILFVYLNVYGLSYNNLAILFFTSGCAFGVLCADRLPQRRSVTGIAAGACHAVAVAAYPAFLVPVLAFGVCFAVLEWQRRRRCIEPLKWCSAGAATALVFLLYVALVFDVNPLSEIWHQAANTTGRIDHEVLNFRKWLAALNDLWVRFPAIVFLDRHISGLSYEFALQFNRVCALFLAALTVLAEVRGKTWQRWVAVAVLPIFAAMTFGFDNSAASAGYIIFFCATSSLLTFARGLEPFRVLMVLVGLPSLVGSLLLINVSNNGYPTAALGLLPTLPIAIGALYRYSPAASARGRWGQTVALLPCVLVLGWLGYYLYFPWPVFRDDRPMHLTAAFATGPYKGMRTSPEKKRYFDDFSAALRAREKAGSTVAIFDHFAAGFLASTMRVDMEDGIYAADAARQVGIYEARGRGPDIIVVMKKIPYQAVYKSYDIRPVDGYEPVVVYAAKKGYRKSLDNADFTIFEAP